MTDKEVKEKEVLFTGSGYRICKMNDLNVVLEKETAPGKYSFIGYYSSILKALNALVTRDVLLNREVTRGIETYIMQVQEMQNTVLADIKLHFETQSDDLFN